MLPFAAVVLAISVSAAVVETITPTGDILKDRDRANGRNFCVVGTPAAINQKFGEVTGKHLFRGKIDDGTGALILFSYGSFPVLAVGEKIEACGRFDKFYVSPSKKHYHNQLKASIILKGKGIASGLVEVGEKITVRPQKPEPPRPP